MTLSDNIMVSPNGFLFDASIGDSYMCNPIGIEIINMMKEGNNQDTIKQKLLTDYVVSENELERDIADFLASLKKFGFIED